MLLWVLLFAPSAEALPPRRLGVHAGIQLVIRLADDTERRRFGLGLDGGAEWIWHDGAYQNTAGTRPTPLLGLNAELYWLAPYVGSEVLVRAGGAWPLTVADGGYVHGVGLVAGAGLGLNTDGFAGFTTQGELLGPLSKVRVDADRFEGTWHVPRLGVGLNLPLNCCGTYL